MVKGPAGTTSMPGGGTAGVVAVAVAVAGAVAVAFAVISVPGLGLRARQPSVDRAAATARMAAEGRPAHPTRALPSGAVKERTLIRVSHLVKRYGTRTAVDDLSFDFEPGEVLGFLGPNGAGKSTTLRIIAGFLGASEGTVSVNGHDMATESLEARRCIGYMPEGVPL